MANINLLPWRAELRKQRQNEFYMVIGFTAFIAAFLLYSVSSFYTSAIADQNGRNDYLKSETRVLDAKIKEIQELRNTRQKLIERMTLIQSLQGNRPVMVHIFDELVRIIPDDLYLTDLNLKDLQVSIKGVAKTQNRVSALMRNFEESQWFTEPVLISLTQTKDKEGENYSFDITVKRKQPGKEE